MSQSLKLSAQRVQAYLSDHGSRFEMVEFDASTRTVKDAAQAIGCEVAQIAKSIIFRDKQRDEAVLVIASGVNRVSMDKLHKATLLN